MLARKAGDKTAAADLDARFETAVDAQQVAPRRQPGGFALEEAPEHNAVAAQQGAREMLDGFGRLGRGAAAAGERPAAGILHAEDGAAAARAALVVRDDQRAHAGKAVRGHETERDQFAERLLDLRL